MTRFDVAGKTALVTGAGSGIGQATAAELARRGAAVALVDLSTARLEDTATRIEALGRQSTRHVCDVGDGQAIAALRDEIAQTHGGLDILVNNAGVALGGTFEEVSEEDFDWLLSINLMGVIRMTRAFLPMLKAAPEAQLVNISSIFGIIAPPGQTAYCASKFGVRGFSNALRLELAGTSVGVTVVHPGGVATRIAEDARHARSASNAEISERLSRARQMLTMDPAKAGAAIADAIERRAPRLVLGADARLAALVERLFPVSHIAVLARITALRGGA